VNHTSLINVAMYAGWPIFLKSIDPGMQRHDSEYIASTILDVINEQPEDCKAKIRTVITDQPSVMKAAWEKVEERASGVHCYGYSAHIENFLAGDFTKIESVANIVDLNCKVSNFYKCCSMAKQVIEQLTLQKYNKSIPTILSSATRCSTQYFMVKRNVRIRNALVCSVNCQRSYVLMDHMLM